MIVASLLALMVTSAAPDVAYGVRTEAGGGYAPVSTSTSTGRVYLTLVPHLGVILSDHRWSVRVDYMPRIYTRIPRDDATSPILALNTFTGQYAQTFGGGWSTLVNGNWSWGQTDYGRASLLADTGGNATNIPPASILYSESGSGTAALVVPASGRDRLTFGLGGSYTKIQACTVTSPCDGSAPPASTTNDVSPYPIQARGNIDSTYIAVFSARDQLTTMFRGAWQAIIPTIESTEGTTNIRSLTLSSAFEHRFSRAFRTTGTGGLAIGLNDTDVSEELRALPVLGGLAAYEGTVARGTRMTGSLGLSLEGYVNPIIRRYQPRLSVSLGTSLLRSDITASLSILAYTTVFDEPTGQIVSSAGNGCTRPVRNADGDLVCAALETGFSVTLPITYHIDHDLTVELTTRMSGMFPALNANVDPADQVISQRELFFTLSFIADATTQRTRAGD